MDNLYELSISEASGLLKKKELSPVDLVASHLLRIQETDEQLNSFITVLGDTSKKKCDTGRKRNFGRGMERKATRDPYRAQRSVLH